MKNQSQCTTMSGLLQEILPFLCDIAAPFTFPVGPEFIQKKIQRDCYAEVDKGGNIMWDAEQPFLNKEKNPHQNQLCQRIGGIDLGQGPVPGLAASFFLTEHEAAVKQIGNQHSNQKGNEIAYLFMKMQNIVASISNQIGEHSVDDTHHTKFDKLSQDSFKFLIQ